MHGRAAPTQTAAYVSDIHSFVTSCRALPVSTTYANQLVRRLAPYVHQRLRVVDMEHAHVKPLSEIIDPGWAAALADVEPDIHRMGDFLRAEIAAGRHYLPAGRNVLRAFTIPFDSIKVLIVGQDPYPTPGHPVGLSFCVAPDVRPLPKSLINIYKELSDDLGVPTPSNGDLTPWTQRGVMLLNRCLTVQVGRPNSHQGKGWEHITDEAIRALNARTDQEGKPKPLVAILWGRNAQTLKPLLTNAAIIESPHPSPLSASRGFFGSRPFSRANQALVAMGAQPVDWALPPAASPAYGQLQPTVSKPIPPLVPRADTPAAPAPQAPTMTPLL